MAGASLSFQLQHWGNDCVHVTAFHLMVLTILANLLQDLWHTTNYMQFYSLSGFMNSWLVTVATLHILHTAQTAQTQANTNKGGIPCYILLLDHILSLVLQRCRCLLWRPLYSLHKALSTGGMEGISFSSKTAEMEDTNNNRFWCPSTTLSIIHSYLPFSTELKKRIHIISCWCIINGDAVNLLYCSFLCFGQLFTLKLVHDFHGNFLVAMAAGKGDPTGSNAFSIQSILTTKCKTCQQIEKATVNTINNVLLFGHQSLL